MVSTGRRLFSALGMIWAALIIILVVGMFAGSDLFASIAAIGLCLAVPGTIFFIMLFGMATLMGDSSSSYSKPKRQARPNDYTYDDIDAFVAELTDEQQAYLKQRLTTRRLALGDDGEMVIVNADESQKAKRS